MENLPDSSWEHGDESSVKQIDSVLRFLNSSAKTNGKIPIHISNVLVCDHDKCQCQCHHCHTMSSAPSEATKLSMFSIKKTRLLIYCLCAIFLMNI